MGTITLTVEGTTVGTVAEGRGVVIRRTVSEQDSARVIQAMARVYSDRFYDEDPETGLRTPREPTIADVVGAWFDGIIEGSKAQVLAVEQEQAAQAARAAVQPITVTEG
jgi:hypothetical protein